MTQSVDLEEIRVKLIEKLTPSGWASKLRSFIQSSDFNIILEKLYAARESGKRFTPPLKQVFRAFEQCPINDLKVVIVGQDPYPYLGIADGIAFSCSMTQKIQPSLKNMFTALDQTNVEFDRDPDLVRWSNQGILMLNSALTCEVDKPATHYDIWHDFIMYVMDMLNLTNKGLIFCLLGKKAHELESVIGNSHYIIKTSHPCSANYSNTVWDCNDMFNTINEIIEKNNGTHFKINW